MFAVKAKLQGHGIVVQWDDGSFIGNTVAEEFLELQIAAGRVVEYPTVGRWQGDEIVEDELAFWLLVNQLFTDVELTAGEVPSAPPIPDGAVA